MWGDVMTKHKWDGYFNEIPTKKDTTPQYEIFLYFALILLAWGGMVYLFGGLGFFLFLAILLVIGLAGADGEDGYD